MSKIKRKIKYAGLQFNLSSSGSLSKELSKALRNMKTIPGIRTKTTFKLHFDDLTASRVHRGKIPDYAKEFAVKYFHLSDFSKLNVHKEDFVSKGYIYWTKRIDFKRFLDESNDDVGKNFIMFGMSRSVLVLVNTRLKKINVFIKPQVKPHLKIKKMRILVSYLLNILATCASSFVFHASCVRIKGKGILFTGLSGSGKSTIAKLIAKHSKGSKILADDAALISFDGKDIYALEIPQDAKKIKESLHTKKIKIERLFFLKKSKRVYVKPFEKLEAFKDIIKNHILNETWFPGNIRDLPIMAWDLVKSCETKILYFPKNKRVVDFLSQSI